MTKGRKPLPTALHILRGNPSRKKLTGLNEPTTKVEVPRTPQHLSPIAKKHFPKIAKQLAAAKVMTRLDTDALAMYCEAYAKWFTSNEELKNCEWITLTENGYPVQTPWLSISNNAFNQMKAMLCEFGLTPSSRTKVQTVPGDNGANKDPWDTI